MFEATTRFFLVFALLGLTGWLRLRDGAVERVERDGDLTMLSLGDVSFVRDFVDRDDYSKGYVYNFEEGAGFSIPHHVALTLHSANTAEIRATGRASFEVKEDE